MELKSCEKEVSELRILYETARQQPNHGSFAQVLPALAHVDLPEVPTLTPAELLETFSSLKSRLAALQPKMDRFRQRLADVDPVTGKSRYGAQTQARVQAMIIGHDELQANLGLLEEPEAGVDDLHRAVAEQRAEAERQARLAEEERQRQEAERLAAEERLLQEQQQKLEAEERRLEEERAERARQGQAARDAERRARDAAAQADREWVASITKGPDGVREQLAILVNGTAGDKVALDTAVGALHTLFSQIVARPEETNFRRIRRDHEKFNQDIGRLKGGKEVLIAAGFELGAIDEVPCFISKEPNIEKDMDGWSAWFELLKATLEIIEEQLIK